MNTDGTYTVRNNETGAEMTFKDVKTAQAMQEYMVFTLGIDAEVL